MEYYIDCRPFLCRTVGVYNQEIFALDISFPTQEAPFWFGAVATKIYKSRGTFLQCDQKTLFTRKTLVLGERYFCQTTKSHSHHALLVKMPLQFHIRHTTLQWLNSTWQVLLDEKNWANIVMKYIPDRWIEEEGYALPYLDRMIADIPSHTHIYSNILPALNYSDLTFSKVALPFEQFNRNTGLDFDQFVDNIRSNTLKIGNITVYFYPTPMGTLIDVNAPLGENSFQVNKIIFPHIIQTCKLKQLGGLLWIDFINIRSTLRKSFIQMIKEGIRHTHFRFTGFTYNDVCELTAPAGQSLSEYLTIHENLYEQALHYIHTVKKYTTTREQPMSLFGQKSRFDSRITI